MRALISDLACIPLLLAADIASVQVSQERHLCAWTSTWPKTPQTPVTCTCRRWCTDTESCAASVALTPVAPRQATRPAFRK